MEIEANERFFEKYELYQMVIKGMNDIEEDKVKFYEDFMDEFERLYLHK